MTTREELSKYIREAKDIPVMVRVTAQGILARASDAQIDVWKTILDSAIAAIRAGDREGFTKILTSAGLPIDMVNFVSSKAFNADTPRD